MPPPVVNNKITIVYTLYYIGRSVYIYVQDRRSGFNFPGAAKEVSGLGVSGADCGGHTQTPEPYNQAAAAVLLPGLNTRSGPRSDIYLTKYPSPPPCVCVFFFHFLFYLAILTCARHLIFENVPTYT